MWLVKGKMSVVGMSGYWHRGNRNMICALDCQPAAPPLNGPVEGAASFRKSKNESNLTCAVEKFAF
jgi:hypothetical protein